MIIQRMTNLFIAFLITVLSKLSPLMRCKKGRVGCDVLNLMRGNKYSDALFSILPLHTRYIFYLSSDPYEQKYCIHRHEQKFAKCSLAIWSL